MARSLNKVILIGNLTRDPEMRYTPQGTAVCTIGLATNRSWKTESGDQKDEVEFHRLVVWDKLAEICSQFLKKGRKAYFEGRLQTRKWTGQDGVEKQTTEIVVTDMIVLDAKPGGEDYSAPSAESTDEKPAKPAAKKENVEEAPEGDINQIDDSDIPF